ncbi:MAG: trigger factor, partial [Acidobacteriota bacterium]
MKATVHEEAPCRRALEVEVPEEEVRARIERTAREYARNLRLPGFRKGHIPPALVRKRYAKEIEGEVIEQLTKDYSWKVIEERELRPIRPPVVEKYSYQDGGPLTFRTTFEILPSFTLGKYKGLEAVRKRPPVTEDLVEKNLEGLRERNARYDAVEGRGLQEGDLAVLDLQPTGADGAPTGKLREGITLDLGPEGVIEGLRKQLLGLEVGGERDVTVEAPAAEAEKAEASGSGDAVATEPSEPDRYRVTLRAVRVRVLPDLDDEFAKDLGEFDSLEALRVRVREDLERRAEDQADRDLREALVKQLVEGHAFPVPEGLVEGELNQMLESLVGAIVQQGGDPARAGIDWEKKREELRPVAEQR